jgi:hypothetical protein
MRSCHSGDSFTSRHQSTAPMSAAVAVVEAAVLAASTANSAIIGGYQPGAQEGGESRAERKG